MIGILIRIISFITNLLIIVVFVDSLLSFFVPPYNPLRRVLDRIVSPMLNPIRRVVPPIAGLDLSPLILLILIEVVSFLLVRLLLLI